MQRLKISREGVILIKSFEGFRPRAIRRDDGQWVIGYGHTVSAREGASVSEADAELLLQYDLIPVAKAVNEGVAAPLNQHQFDALASFAFSVGVDRFQSSDVLSRLNAGFAGEAADAMIGWPEPVLAETALRRRAAERALFVANPAWPVALADLLAAPLPPPSIASAPAQVEDEVPADAPENVVVTPPSPDGATVPDMQSQGLTTSTPEEADETVSSAIESVPEAVETPSPTLAAPIPFDDSPFESALVDSIPDAAQNARHAAVASLLAEPAPALRQSEPEPEPASFVEDASPDTETPPEDETVAAVEAEPESVATPETTPDAPGAISEALEADAAAATSDDQSTDEQAADVPAQVVAPFADAAPVQTATPPVHRYSAYSGAIIGPLPGPVFAPFSSFAPPVAPVGAESVDEESADAASTGEVEKSLPAEPLPAETVQPLVAETPQSDPVDQAPAAEAPPSPAPWYVANETAQVDPLPSAISAEPVAPELSAVEPAIVEPTVPEPVMQTPTFAEPLANPFEVAFQTPVQSSPFDAAPVVEPAVEAPGEPPVELPRFNAFAPAASVVTADPWPAISAVSEPRTDGELVLSAAPETDVFASPRLVWPHGEQQGENPPPLFEDDGSLRLVPGNILRHETFEEVAPDKIPWGELAAYGLMGGFGLVSFGMSMAAFRRASESSSGGDGVTLIAVVLAVIGAACVGVSAYNLYRRWGRTEEE